MKYINIPFERVVSLYRQGESSRTFVRRANGELEQLGSDFYSLNTFINKNQYFEQIEED